MSVRDHAVGLAGLERRTLKNLQQRGMIVTIDLAHRPAKCAPLISERFKMHCSFGCISLLQPVAVDEQAHRDPCVEAPAHAEFRERVRTVGSAARRRQQQRHR